MKVWDETSDPAWAQTVGEITWNKIGDDYTKTFTCPRCSHETTFVMEWSALDPLLPTLIATRLYGPDVPERVFVRCLCAVVHDGRPDDAEGRGCGSGAVVWGPDELAVATVPLPDQLPMYLLLRWQKAADQVAVTALDLIRSAAEKWGTTIAGLTGVFSLIALIRGPEGVSQLKDS